MQSPALTDDFVSHGCLQHLSMIARSSMRVFAPPTLRPDQSHRRAR